MKKAFLTSIVLLLFATAHAEPKLKWPDIEYPSLMITNFMFFCVNQLDQSALSNNTQAYLKNPVGANQVHKDVCGCITDNYRANNSEFLFVIEQEATEQEGIPYFHKYFQECKLLNNQRQLMNSGT